MRTKDIMAGVVTAIVVIASTVSYSAAVFSGPLAGFLPVGIGYGLVGGAITAAIFAFRSGIPFAIAGPDSRPTAVLAALAASVALPSRAALGPSSGREADAALALLALLVATAFTGLVLYFCGRRRVGRWVRFVPFPVVGGFMAASGWLLAEGAVRILIPVPLAWSTLSNLTATHFEQLAVALLFAGALAVAARSKYILSFPAMLVGATALAHVVRHALGISVQDARAAGWLLKVPSHAVLPIVWLAQHWHAPRTDALLQQGGECVALVVVTAFTLLLGITSIEVDTRLDKDVDVDRELRVNGLANVAASLAGGMAGTLSLSRTLFNLQNGARSRLSGIIVAVACLLTLAFGTGALAFVPVPLLAGMLFRLGFSMLHDWLVRGWKRMDRVDYFQVFLILILIVVFGFMAGVAMGVVASCVTFAVNTGRLGLVKQESDRTKYSSRVERSTLETRELIRHGGAIQILWLHGFVFFGSVNNLLQHVKERVTAQPPGLCRMVLLDFREVMGIDSSAVMIFVRLRQFAERENFLLIFSALLPEVESLLRLGGVLGNGQQTCRVFPVLDPALEWCEDRLLNDSMSAEEAKRSADEWLAREIGGHEMFRQFASYLEMVSYPAGEALFKQGDAGEFLCLVYSGRVSVVFRTAEGQELRLRSIEKHTLVGEMGLYRATPRGATVLVDQPTVVYRLSREALEQMEADDPPLAMAFHKFVVRALAERLDFANREVAALQG